jgi:hypothetical protein
LDLDDSGEPAARLTAPVRAYHHAAFAPVTVAMQETYGYATLKKPGKALTAARRIGRGELQGISRGAHLMDVAQAHFDQGHRRTAATTLLDARDVSPVWFRPQVTTGLDAASGRPDRPVGWARAASPRLADLRLAVSDAGEGGEDVGDLGAGGVVGLDVDEAHGPVLVDDQDGGPR